jgi:spore coat polysaccharide biosynthesis protein SpsF
VRTAVIVQARLGSTRLPGKVLKSLGSRTVLEEVLHRCKAIPGTDVVVCAIPDVREDDLLIPPAQSAGAIIARGPSNDVLSRYVRAANLVNADVVMRVTSDCPLIDPAVCGEVLARRAEACADYACNGDPPSFPLGLDCEAFTAEALQRADRMANSAFDREHVTPWLSRAPDIRRTVVRGPGGGMQEHRWTLDYPEDYAFLRALFSLLPPPPAIPSWTEVADLLTLRPDISAINAMRHARHA